MADVAEELAEAEASVDARKVHGLVDLDVGAHQGYPTLDALRDQPPATIVEIVRIHREPALRLRGDAQSLAEVAGSSQDENGSPSTCERSSAAMTVFTHPVTSSSH